jgi:hypothetical protein
MSLNFPQYNPFLHQFSRPANPEFDVYRRWSKLDLGWHPTAARPPDLEDTMKYWIIVFGILLYSPAQLAQQADDSAEIRDLLVNSYVNGIYVNRDEHAVRNGFHPDFVLHVLDDEHLIQAPLDMWLARLELDGTKNSTPYDYEFKSIDVTGNSATVKMEIYEDAVQIYTDYFGLYKFANGWKIVNKIFYGHN